MNRGYIFLAVIFGLTAVMLGAMGAHALKAVLTADQLDSFETGVRYQMYHAIVLLLLGLKNIQSKAIGWLFGLGVLFFSVSIYLLAIDGPILNTSLNWLGPITPIGGSLIIIGWFVMGWQLLRKQPAA